MSTIEERLGQIRSRIESAAGGREVRIIGVTKTVSAERIRESAAAGLLVYGENRIQEALPKISALADAALEWHFIGHLQTNKARDAVRHFVLIHSVDSERLLLQVDREAARQGRMAEVLLELNLAGEESKSGMPEAQLDRILETSAALQNTRVRGLMTVPPFLEDPEQVRPYFRSLRAIRDARLPRYPLLTELSMGMSHDYVAAVEEGATMVRIGTALFGQR